MFICFFNQNVFYEESIRYPFMEEKECVCVCVCVCVISLQCNYGLISLKNFDGSDPQPQQKAK